MPAPIDDQGRYRVVLSYDGLTRLGFTLVGARQLVSTQPLTLSADRRRLATLLGARAALPARLSLTQRGISLRGAEELARTAPLTDYWDRWRVARLLGEISVPSTAHDVLELFDYPGGYAGRFDGIDR